MEGVDEQTGRSERASKRVWIEFGSGSDRVRSGSASLLVLSPGMARAITWLRGRPATLRRGLLLALFLAATCVVPRWWCGRDAQDLFEGKRDAHEPMARSLIAFTSARIGRASYHTGSARFDGEWALMTCQMTVLGLGQMVHAHPEMRAQAMPAIEACLDWMIREETWTFGARAWGTPQAGPSGQAHAYLGYLNVALSMHRTLAPDSRFAALNERLSEAFAERLASEPLHALETYPGQTYPADLATVVASLALHDRATGADHRALLEDWGRRFRAEAVDPDTGLVFQALTPSTGAPADEARGSGTAFAAYFLAFADLELSRELFEALRSCCSGSLAGFGVVEEYPPGSEGGWGDVDSGPVVLNIGPSATAFMIASARIHGDRELFARLLRTAVLFGAPTQSEGARTFLLGGPLGNALLFAMLTATPPEARP